jgi:hypothetical protein
MRFAPAFLFRLLTVVVLLARGATAFALVDQTARISKVEGEIERLEAERDRVLDEMRDGKYCSICGMSKSQIERGGETFQHHLDEVRGKEVPASEAVIAKKEAEFERKLAALRKELERLNDTQERYEQEKYDKKHQEDVDRQNDAIRQRQFQLQRRGGGSGTSGYGTSQPTLSAEQRRTMAQAEALTALGKWLSSALKPRPAARPEPEPPPRSLNPTTRRVVTKQGTTLFSDTEAALRPTTQKTVVENRQREAAEEERAGAAKRQFAAMMMDWLTPESKPAAESSESSTSAGTSGGFFQDIVDKTRQTLIDEMRGQVEEDGTISLRDAAKTGAISVIKGAEADIRDSAYDAALALLPAEEQQRVRSYKMMGSWASRDPDSILASEGEKWDKDVAEQMDQISNAPSGH